jgi:hypothetical protein
LIRNSHANTGSLETFESCAATPMQIPPVPV